MRFYEAISELNINLENRMFTVCEGDHAGEKMIVSAGEPVWMSDEAGLFSMHTSEALASKNGALTKMGGEKVFAEILGNEKRMVICGAGHVSMPVIDIAKLLGFHVTVIDDRQQFIDTALDHGADEGKCMGFEEALSGIPGTPDTFFVIVTRGHMSDSECLLSIVKKSYAYIGMIGSRRKVARVKQTLADAGVTQEVIESVHTPIGLEIGAETPEEIAVAIMAEIIEVKNKTSRNEGMTKDILRELEAGGREEYALATIVSKEGSSPRGAGTRMLVRPDGSIAGTIGGGLAEARIIEYAAEMLSGESGTDKSKPAMIRVDMTGKEVADEGMICGGVVEVMIEVV